MKSQKLYIPVGSCYVYCTSFDGTIPTDETIETEDNRLGFIQDGASLQYEPSTTTLKDDFGLIQRVIITEEEVTLSFSNIAWSSLDFDKFALTGRVTDDDSTGHRTVKIGGLSNDTQATYLFRLVHPDKQNGTVRITVVGTQSGGFTLEYKADEAAQMAVEITATPSDSEGTLILYDEEIPKKDSSTTTS